MAHCLSPGVTAASHSAPARAAQPASHGCDACVTRPAEDRAVAGFRSVGAAGKSIEAVLNVAFADDPPVASHATHAVLIRTDDLDLSAGSLISPTPALSILLYRVDFNKTMRPAWSSLGSIDGHCHLPLDLHFLLTAWADNAEDEHQIIGRALQCLETVGALSGPLLYPTGDWEPGEAVQLYLEDMATDDLMRTF